MDKIARATPESTAWSVTQRVPRHAKILARVRMLTTGCESTTHSTATLIRCESDYYRVRHG